MPDEDLISEARRFLGAGDMRKAEALARQALEGGEASAHGLLSQILLRRGDLEAAERHALQALDADPEDVVTLAYLGAIRLAGGRNDEALASYRAAAEKRPNNAVLQNEYGNALAAAGRLREAETVLRRAVSLRSDIAEIHNNLGNVLRAQGRYQEAAECYRLALPLRPDYAEALSNLGVARLSLGETDDAIETFLRALEIQPDNALAHTNLGSAYAAKGRLTDAVAAHRAALVLWPTLAQAHNNLGIALKDQGLLHDAREAYENALQADPTDAGVRSNLLMSLSYDPAVDGGALLDAHRSWAEAHEGPVSPITEHDWTPDRRLRIGYVSPDFWTHSVAYFIEPVLASHDRAVVETFCYADVARPDETTARLQDLADHWRDTVSLDDAALYDQIRADRIDILIDLCGHTGNNRLPVFGCRAAPVQITWIGYPATTGLSQMDYRITDAWADPPGETDRFHSEELLRLPSGFSCYRRPTDGPELGAPAEGQPLTFGSFNNLSKVTDDAIALWSELLKRRPESRLLLKSRQLADDGVRERIERTFAENGVGADRLDLRARLAYPKDHLALYNEVHVALDTFPYNGTTTTCEALWMGVPVVALAGALHAGRVGVSLLNQVGHPDWVAETPEGYIAAALALADNPPARAEVRRALAQSSLTDAPGFTRGLEDALRTIWRQRCEDAAQPG